MKTVNTVFPLASSANRVAIITGLLAGTVSKVEAELAVERDVGKRTRCKPVVAAGVRYDSVSDAAKFLVLIRPGRSSKEAFFRAVQSEQKRIARLCTQDCWDGYYWAV